MASFVDAVRYYCVWCCSSSELQAIDGATLAYLLLGDKKEEVPSPLVCHVRTLAAVNHVLAHLLELSRHVQLNEGSYTPFVCLPSSTHTYTIVDF